MATASVIVTFVLTIVVAFMAMHYTLTAFDVRRQVAIGAGVLFAVLCVVFLIILKGM